MFDLLGLKTDTTLAPYTTYKIGGKADYFFVAKNKTDLINAITQATREKVPYFLLGTGANILVGDKGFRGLVIKNEAKDFYFRDNFLVTESGATISDLIVKCVNKNLSGLEHFAGIPSSVGGALWQNLHFLSPDRKSTLFLGDIVESAEILDEKNNIKRVDKKFFEFGYDYSILHRKSYIVNEVTFRLTPSESEVIKKQISENLKWRNKKQPQLTEFPSCGSVFKKIKDVGAGRLIDQAGLKGYTIGGAKVSEKHANYIINTGNATANDILSVIKIIQEKVKARTGYILEPEISFVGEF